MPKFLVDIEEVKSDEGGFGCGNFIFLVIFCVVLFAVCTR